MFDKYILVEDTLRNVTDGDRVIGFEFDARLPYYRGLGLSMIEDLAVAIDGQPVARDAVSLLLRGHAYRLLDLAEVLDSRWEMGEVATIRVDRPGGLSQGTHEIELHERLRISYMPVPGGGSDRKRLVLQSADGS